MLTEKEKQRYARHLALDEIGETGQEKIKNARILVVGAGGLGSPVLLYLAAAGVGTIGIMDDDTVSESNLQRQILYDSLDVGKQKTDIAAGRIRALNSYCKVIPHSYRLTSANADATVKAYDLVIDATDNLSSRYVINDACVRTGKAFIYGSICEFNGQVSVFNYKGGPTYRDLFEYHDEIPDFKQPLGVIGVLPGIVGSIQANEALKIIIESGNILSGKLLLINILNNSFETISLR